MWKSRWKVLNSTVKTGFQGGVLHIFHGVFHMLKVKQEFLQCVYRQNVENFSPVRMAESLGPGRARLKGGGGAGRREE